MTQVTRVEATDGDKGHYGQFSYHFVGDEAHKYFRINENTGERQYFEWFTINLPWTRVTS